MTARSGSGSAAGRRRRRALHQWFQDRRRDFSWRRDPDPWRVFVAEMLLRRTRADQVEAHLGEVLDRFPDPATMARARVATVERVLRPFGLLWRARNLHECARRIVREHGGQVPVDHDALLALPGVGPYVAAAVVSVVDDHPVVLVDTNTVRVATRVAGIHRSGDIRRRADVQTAIHDLLGGPALASDWWAVIDLAATICRPQAPGCTDCPIQGDCATAALIRSG